MLSSSLHPFLSFQPRRSIARSLLFSSHSTSLLRLLSTIQLILQSISCYHIGARPQLEETRQREDSEGGLPTQTRIFPAPQPRIQRLRRVRSVRTIGFFHSDSRHAPAEDRDFDPLLSCSLAPHLTRAERSRAIKPIGETEEAVTRAGI